MQTTPCSCGPARRERLELARPRGVDIGDGLHDSARASVVRGVRQEPIAVFGPDYAAALVKDLAGDIGNPRPILAGGDDRKCGLLG